MNEAALKNSHSLLRNWLKDGSLSGDEWVALNPRRHDLTKGSFSVNTRTGVWKDFAMDDVGGKDLISLRAYLDDCKQGEAKTRIAGELGLIPGGCGERLTTASPLMKKIPRKTDSPSYEIPYGELEGADELPEKIVHPQWGVPRVVWSYRNEAGKHLGCACRYDFKNGDKKVLPYSYFYRQYGPSGWDWRAMHKPRPLFNLPELIADTDKIVIVTEGEKAACACTELFPEAIATTWPMGCKALMYANWKPLKGRKIILWPDADQEGVNAMDCLGHELLNEYEALSVKLPRIPTSLPKGFDAYDALHDPDFGRDKALRLLGGTLKPEGPFYRPSQRKDEP